MQNDWQQFQGMKKLTVFGGTFDPVHMGHLMMAEAVRDCLQMDGVLFIPAGLPPHKKTQSITPNHHRYAMLQAAIAGNPRFFCSDMEFKRTGNSYTIDTIRQLKAVCGETELYFMTGLDAIEQIGSWREAEALVNSCRFVVLNRPGYDTQRLKEVFLAMGADYNRLIFVDAPLVAISSTEIRRRVRAGESIRYLLPREVEEYIDENKLYTADGAANEGEAAIRLNGETL